MRENVVKKGKPSTGGRSTVRLWERDRVRRRKGEEER